MRPMRFYLIVHSAPRPIVCRNSGAMTLLVANITPTADLGGERNCDAGGMPGQPAPLHFLTTEILRRKENFACVRIFYCGSRRKTSDVDVTAIHCGRSHVEARLITGSANAK